MLRRVAVGLSGGVDSAVAALFLKQKGFEVKGVFMKNWDETDETGLCSVQRDREDALYVCQALGISFTEVNFVKQYWSEVFSYLIIDYETGFTPNPDILCNRHIKFNSFLEYCVNELHVDAIATGHYALTSYGPYLENINSSEPAQLLQPVDKFKDQTFFLSQVEQDALKKVMFPLGHYLKSQVKEIAAENNLYRVSKKKESTGICFIGKRKFQDFILDYIPSRPGPMRDLSTGLWLKNHDGLFMWTLGQCCRVTGFTDRYFVAKKNLEENLLYVVPRTDHPALFTTILYTSAPHWIANVPLNSLGMLACRFRFQHTKPTVECRIFSTGSQLMILLERPLKAITPGQFAVFYKNNECLGSARILSPGPSLFTLKKSVPTDYREYEHYDEWRKKYSV